MEITTDNYRAGAEYAARLEIEQRYKQQGYSVFRDYKMDECTFDLVAEKGDEKFAFEFRSRPINGADREAMEARRIYAKKHNIHYRVVLAPMPKSKKLYVEGLEETLEKEFQNQKAKRLYIEGLKETLENEFQNQIPKDIDELSTYTKVDEIDDINVEEFNMKSSQEIRIKGSGGIVVVLCLGKKEEDYPIYSFPFDFDGIWRFNEKEKISLVELNDLKFDTSSYYM